MPPKGPTYSELLMADRALKTFLSTVGVEVLAKVVFLSKLLVAD